MLGFTNEINKTNDTYILKYTIKNNNGTTFAAQDIRAYVAHPNYTLINYFMIYSNARYESNVPPKLCV